jgi:hypothetical protein
MTVRLTLPDEVAEGLSNCDPQSKHHDIGKPCFTYLAVDQKILCGTCKGSGEMPKQEDLRCPSCDGSGLATEVEIRSEAIGEEYGGAPVACGTRHVGILTLDPPIPVVDNPDTNPGHAVTVDDDGIWLWSLDDDEEPINLIDRIAGTPVVGGFVHAVTPQEKP